MTRAPDGGQTGSGPDGGPTGPVPEPEGRGPEAGAPATQLPEDQATTAQAPEDQEPTAPRRRRSRNRGRSRRNGATGAGSEELTAGSSGGDALAQVPEAGPSEHGAARPVERPAPPTYGPLQAAFFDLDKTVIAKASMVAFGRPFYHGGLIDRRTVLRALYGQLVYLHLGASEQKLARIRESVLRLSRGWHRDRVCEIVEEAIEEIVEPIIFAEAADLIDWHHDQGRVVVIVSASPDEIVAPLSRFLGADECIASRAQLDDDGRYTGP